MAAVNSSAGDAASVVRRPSTYACLHRFNQCLYQLVQDLEVRDKRGMYAHMREGRPSGDLFFPVYGLSAGEFAVFKVLGENVRRGNTRPRDAALEKL